MLGGAKVSDKLGVIANLLGKVDRLLIGGGMAYTFLKAQGHEVGNSLLEADQLDTVRGFLAEAAKRGVELVLPVDVVAADRVRRRRASTRSSRPTRSRPTAMGLDIGPRTRRAVRREARRRQDRLLERPDGRVRVRRRSPAAPARSPRP